MVSFEEFEPQRVAEAAALRVISQAILHGGSFVLDSEDLAEVSKRDDAAGEMEMAAGA
jgi:hypothetical protein